MKFFRLLIITSLTLTFGITIAQDSTKQKNRLKVIEYSFLHDSFNIQPPFAINERQPMVLRLKDVNPFIYTINISVFQSDIVNNETLNQKDWTKELQVSFKPLSNILIDQRLELPPITDRGIVDAQKAILSIQNSLATYPDNLNKLLSDAELQLEQQKSFNVDSEISEIQARIRSLSTDAKGYQSKIDGAMAIIKGLINDTIQSAATINTTLQKQTEAQRLLDEQKSDSTKSGSRKVQDLETKLTSISENLAAQRTLLQKRRETLANLNLQVSELGKANAGALKDIVEAQQQLKVLESQQQNKAAITGQLTNQINQYRRQREEIASLNLKLFDQQAILTAANYSDKDETEILNLLSALQKHILKLNALIDFYGQLTSLVHLPENSYFEINSKINHLLKNTLQIERGDLYSYYTNAISNIDSTLIKSRRLVNKLGSVQVNQRAAAYSLIAAKLSAYQDLRNNFDGQQLMRQIQFLLSMISEENFTASASRLLSYEENADVVRYRVELKPNSVTDIPQGKAPEVLDFSVLIVNGVKIDVSSGFALDIGLKEPTYYFDRTTDPTGDSVFVRKNNLGNISPAIAGFLNVYKRTSKSIKIGGSFGIGLSNTGRFRLYLGPTLIVGRKERICISGGGAFGATSALANGYKVDKGVKNSASVPSEVPTVLDRYVTGWYLGISFNLTGAKNREFIKNLKFK